MCFGIFQMTYAGHDKRWPLTTNCGALILLGICAFGVDAQERLLWGELDAGSYTVGYRMFFEVDGSREYDGKAGRPVLFQVWYPAAATEAVRLRYGTYFDVPPADVHPQLGSRLRRFARDVACKDLFGRESESLLRPAERRAFDRLLKTRTAAVANAREAPGKFPVVLYHPGSGGSFEENSLLFEYLASFGYIVVSSAFQSPLTDSVSNSVGGIERSGPDFAFLLDHMRSWPNADTTRPAAAGHSAGAQAILQWMGTSRCPLSAAVSLDTALEYDEFLNLHRMLLDSLSKLIPPKIPVLLLARTQPKPRFSAFRDYLRHAPRYEGTVADVKHDDFLTHGFLGRALRGSRQAAMVRRSYEDVCRTVRSFLDSVFDARTGSAALPEQPPSSRVTLRYVREAR